MVMCTDRSRKSWKRIKAQDLYWKIRTDNWDLDLVAIVFEEKIVVKQTCPDL
jgi:hypothetical protein